MENMENIGDIDKTSGSNIVVPGDVTNVDMSKQNIDKEDVKTRIAQLKSDVYDIIRNQEILALQNSNLQELKIKKNQEIGLLEQSIYGK